MLPDVFEVTKSVQKMKFSITDFFSKCDQPADLVTFTEEIRNGKLHLLCSVLFASIHFSELQILFIFIQNQPFDRKIFRSYLIKVC